MNIFVYHTPELTPTEPMPDCAIVVDVLRATTTIATALHAGAESVRAFSDIDRLNQVSESCPTERRLKIGERGGKTVAGFDLGNSPLGCTSDVVMGKQIFMTTTNGTRALQRVERAPTLLTAALVNRQAVVQYLCDRQPATIGIVGSGWEGGYSLEDTVCAGAIVQGILKETNGELDKLIGNDEAVAALTLYQQWCDRLPELLRLASHGQRLLRLNCDDDLSYCAQLDILDIVPVQKEMGMLVKL
ncbi:2-phosphosulfolactate phosphatase family protein [bacterium]|nr:2-phosphosulfolactate phosphatase family protein [bacterium]